VLSSVIIQKAKDQWSYLWNK